MRIGPAVRLLIQNYAIDIHSIQGTGPQHTILKGDVLQLIKSRKLSPVSPSSKLNIEKETSIDKSALSSSSILAGNSKYFDIPLSNMRRTIAKRLTESKRSIPHVYASISVNSDAALQLRNELKIQGIIVSLNDIIVKTAAVSLQSVPEINVQYVNGSVHSQASIDISIAVATEFGLITPIVRNADRLGINEISTKIKELVQKAKQNKLRLDEFQGGTFTISNLGMYDIRHFTAIINPPQAAILAVGGNREWLSVDHLSNESTMTVTLCFDARAIGEIDANRFLQHFQQFFADPNRLMLAGVDNLLPDHNLNIADLL